MARFDEPTAENMTAWNEWVATRPEPVKSLCERFDPWTLYRLASSGHRVRIHSYSEDGTMTVVVSGDFNFVAFERNVFGIKPDDLTECDLPAEGEVLGVGMTESETHAYINAERAKRGLPPMDFTTDDQA